MRKATDGVGEPQRPKTQAAAAGKDERGAIFSWSMVE